MLSKYLIFFFDSSDVCLQLNFFALNLNAKIEYRFTNISIDCRDTLLAYSDGKVLNYSKFYNNDKETYSSGLSSPSLFIDAKTHKDLSMNNLGLSLLHVT